MADSNNVYRTKEAIRAAFLGLLETTGVQEIAAKEVADNARVSRTTFYRYYNDVYDLLTDCFFTYCSGPFASPPPDSDNETFFDHLYESAIAGAKRVAQYRILFLAGLDCNDAAFDLEFEKRVVNPAEEQAKEMIGRLGVTSENSIIAIDRIAAICVDLQTRILEGWLREGCVEAPEEIAYIGSNVSIRFAQAMKRNVEETRRAI